MWPNKVVPFTGLGRAYEGDPGRFPGADSFELVLDLNFLLTTTAY
jgi:hypothetical protein